jgi:hypothetical protein
MRSIRSTPTGGRPLPGFGCGRLVFQNRRWQGSNILGDFDRYERRQLRGTRHTDNAKIGQTAPLINLGRQQSVPPRNCRNVRSWCHRF